ncbi:hypothetical protein RJ641_025365 [Dillenia turbinata]|uniref:Uncharacterized protein n=1 Tax=Dillenia turbinata TaxID=194707 RepID=A0AAN8WCY8_9MAGN
MLGLIAFALLILACSYWKLSGYLDGGESGDRGTNDSSAETNSSYGSDAVKPPPVFEEKMLVIMAGQLKPTFIATPICSRASSFNDGDTSSKKETTSSDKADRKVEDGKQDGCAQVEMGSMENHGGADQGH